MNREELEQNFIADYTRGSNFCTTSYNKGGVCIYVHKSLNFGNIYLETYCIEKDFKVCAIKFNLNSIQGYIITIYRSPSGNFNSFVNELDTTLRKIYIPTLEYIICCEINIDYLTNN